MTSKTISLTGEEIKAEYSGGANAWLRNDGTAVVYASGAPGITAGADGTVSIPAGQSVGFYGANGTVYLKGTGSVQLIGSDYSTNPFRNSAASGSSGADDVARAAIEAHAGNAGIHVTADEKAFWNGKADKSDIPTKVSELLNDSGFITSPDGGNAAKLQGKIASDFVENMLNQDMHFSFVWGDSNYITNQIDADIPAVPVLSNYTFILTRNDERKVMSVLAIGADYTENIYVYHQQSGWTKINDNGNATTLGGFSAEDFALSAHSNASNQIQIPDNVDVPMWIADNAKLYTRYYSNTFNTGLTNIPGGDPNDWVWYYTDGFNIIATGNMSRKVWISAVINQEFRGWTQINSTDADTLGGKSVGDLALKSELTALEARIAALEGGK